MLNHIDESDLMEFDDCKMKDRTMILILINRVEQLIGAVNNLESRVKNGSES